MGERLKNVTTAAILLGLFAANRYLWEDLQLLVRFVTLFSVLFHAWLLGKTFLPRRSGTVQSGFGIVLFFSLFSLTETVWFYAGPTLNAAADYWSLLIAMIGALLCYVFFPEREQHNDPAEHTEWDTKRIISTLLIGATTLVLCAFVVVSAWKSATTASIRTPWLLLPSGILPALAFTWMVVPLSAWLVRSRVFTAVSASLAMLATTVIAPIVYRLGFGFDGFLHVAGEHQILSTGTLNPKPLYYIGQYVFTTWITRTTDIPIEVVDRWLVPVAAAILIPFSVFLVTRTLTRERQALSFLALALVPFAPFVATTPQSFAYILGFCAVLLSLGNAEETTWPAPLIIAAWSAAIHPLAGIPFFCIAFAILLVRSPQAKLPILRYILAGLSAFAAAASIPLLFFILSLHGGAEIHWNLNSLFALGPWQSLLSSLTPWIGNMYVLWPAWASLVQQSIPFLVFLLACGTIWIMPKGHRLPYIVLVGSSVLLVISGAVLKAAGDFAFLIDYERGNYADRMLLLATFSLIAASIPAIATLFQRARKYPSFFSVLLLVALGAIAGAQSYNALPRNDALVTGHGWSVGASDVEAAQTINRDAGKDPYTVLADQSVSAAAVSQYGFKRYNGDIFYYPIPTGGALYDTFLRMTYQEPSRDTAKDAANLGGSKLVYVVVNDYWWNADQLTESISAIADHEWTIGNPDAGLGNVVHLYKFDLNTSSKR